MDLDGTLLDFDKQEAVALKRLFESQGVPFTPDISAYYNEINGKLWRAYERGEITLDNTLYTRFPRALEKFGFRDIDGVKWDGVYRKFLADGYFLMDGAVDTVKALNKKYRLAIITNGITNTQETRLKQAELRDYFEAIFVSQKIGFQKPDPGFFKVVFEYFNDVNREEMLVVGDSINTDIKGAAAVGIKSCWYNPKGKIAPKNCKPDYEIINLLNCLKIAGSMV